MLSTIKATILANARKPSVWIWTLLFPIILSTIFILMFSSLKNSQSVDPVPVAVLEDGAWETSGFSQVVDALNAEGDDRLLDVRPVSSIEEGERLLDSGEVKRISLTRSTPDYTVRYYYALLGMATLFAAQVAMEATVDAAGDLSPLGARRCVGSQSRFATLASTLVACWAMALVNLALVFAFVRLVAGVDFSGREGLALLGIATASFLSIGLGMFVAVLPLRGGKGPREGLLTLLTCLGALFAGLYGMPSMFLADEVAHAFPAEAWLNPSKLISDMFASLYFYEDLTPFFARAVACVAFALALLVVATLVFRRQRYEHL